MVGSEPLPESSRGGAESGGTDEGTAQRFEAIERLLMGQQPVFGESGVQYEVGHTVMSPAVLTTQFVIKHPPAFAMFQDWLRKHDMFPETVEGVELPADALLRDLRVAVNGLLAFEDAAIHIQEELRGRPDPRQ
jgi:hypothetical protein